MNDNERINEFFRKTAQTKGHQHKVIVGDFNRKGINWVDVTAESRDNNNFIEAVRDSYLTQHIVKPTRGRGTTQPSVLDLVFTSGEQDIDDIFMQAPLGKSDHVVLKVDFRFTSEEQPLCREISDYKKANWGKFREQLTIDWDNFFQDCNDNLDKMWDKFERMYKMVEESCIPKRRVQVSKRAYRYALDRKSLSVRKKKYRLWKRYMESKDRLIYQQYCRSRNQLRRMTR